MLWGMNHCSQRRNSFQQMCGFSAAAAGPNGALVELLARVVATGRTSITVEVDMYSEDLLTGERQHGTHGRFVLVAVDADGRAVPVLPLDSTAAQNGPPHGP